MIREIVNEATKSNIITNDMLDALNKYLQDNRLFIDNLYTDGENIYGDINWGDWKHDHLRSNYLIDKYFKERGYVVKHNYIVTDEDGSDTYSASHKWTLSKIDDDKITEGIINEGYDFLQVLKLDDAMATFIDNLSDADLDRDLRLFSKIAKELGVENYADLYVLIADDSEYDLSQYKDDKLTYVKDLYKLKNNVKVYKYNDKTFVFERHSNGNYFIYAKTENDLDDIIDYVEQQYDFDDLDEKLEQKDIDFNDMYFPRIDVKNNRYDYYKYKDKEFVFDKEKDLLIYLFKDDEEISELGDNAPYRELDAIGFNKNNWEDKDERNQYLDHYIDDLDAESSALMNDFIKYELPQYKKETVTEDTTDIKSLNKTHNKYVADFIMDADIEESNSYYEEDAKENADGAIDLAIKDLAVKVKKAIDEKLDVDNTYVDLSDNDVGISSMYRDSSVIYPIIYIDKKIEEDIAISVIAECVGLAGVGTYTFEDLDYNNYSTVSGWNIPNSYGGWKEYAEVDAEVTVGMDIKSVENVKNEF